MTSINKTIADDRFKTKIQARAIELGIHHKGPLVIVKPFSIVILLATSAPRFAKSTTS